MHAALISATCVTGSCALECVLWFNRSPSAAVVPR